jgi:hypothetical protein
MFFCTLASEQLGLILCPHWRTWLCSRIDLLNQPSNHKQGQFEFHKTWVSAYGSCSVLFPGTGFGPPLLPEAGHVQDRRHCSLSLTASRAGRLNESRHSVTTPSKPTGSDEDPASAEDAAQILLAPESGKSMIGGRAIVKSVA